MKKKIYVVLVLLLALQFVGCSSSKIKTLNTDQKEKVFSKKNPNAYLKIIGTEPFWSIEVSEDKIVYAPLDGDKVEFPYNIATIEKGSGHILYNTVNGKGTIHIRLTNESCTDGMSDNLYDFKADVEIVQMKKMTKLKGCGNYLSNESLAGKWILSELNTKKISEKEKELIPFIEFDLEANHISGNAGCNGLSASFVLRDKELRFSEILLTRMFCDNIEIEKNVVDALKEITSYKINGNTLNLYKGKTLEMVFKK